MTLISYEVIDFFPVKVGKPEVKERKRENFIFTSRDKTKDKSRIGEREREMEFFYSIEKKFKEDISNLNCVCE